MSPANHTPDLCRAKTNECLDSTQHGVTKPQRVMLEHMSETWHRIADNLPANDA